MLTNNKENPIQAYPEEGDRSKYSVEKWKFLIEAPFEISNRCCDVMKKGIVHQYERETGRKGITGQMAAESRLRTQKWLESGCNGFDLKSPKSNPMSFWLEQDVLKYIKENNIEICSVYGEIVEENEIDGQITLTDFGFDTQPKLKTTGCQRTGCMFCGFGCHLEKESRFEKMKISHPKQYEYIMKPWNEGGLGYKEVIDWLNTNGNLHIRY